MGDRCVGSKNVRRKYFRHFDNECYIFRLAEDELTVTIESICIFFSLYFSHSFVVKQRFKKNLFQQFGAFPGPQM